MDHPDFRIVGKVFATLGYPDENWGMVKLTPEQQHAFIKSNGAFRPCNGVWGQRGATNIHLASAKKSQMKNALDAAIGNVLSQPKKKARNSMSNKKV